MSQDLNPVRENMTIVIPSDAQRISAKIRKFKGIGWLL